MVTNIIITSKGKVEESRQREEETQVSSSLYLEYVCNHTLNSVPVYACKQGRKGDGRLN